MPTELLNKAKKVVRDKRAASLSAFVAEAVREKLQRDALEDVLADMEKRLGPSTKKEQAWARSVIYK